MKERLGNAVKNVMQHANGNVWSTEISATILPLENGMKYLIFTTTFWIVWFPILYNLSMDFSY